MVQSNPLNLQEVALEMRKNYLCKNLVAPNDFRNSLRGILKRNLSWPFRKVLDKISVQSFQKLQDLDQINKGFTYLLCHGYELFILFCSNFLPNFSSLLFLQRIYFIGQVERCSGPCQVSLMELFGKNNQLLTTIAKQLFYWNTELEPFAKILKS